MIARKILFLRALCAVLGAPLIAVRNALSVESSADDVVTYAGKVANSSASDENDGVLLKVVTDTGDVAGSFHSVGKSYSGDLTESGVRLFRRGSRNLCANAALLRATLICRAVLQGVEALLQNGSLRLIGLVLSALSYELVKGWHVFPPFLQ